LLLAIPAPIFKMFPEADVMAFGSVDKKNDISFPP
jgi:hypothetical protein